MASLPGLSEAGQYEGSARRRSLAGLKPSLYKRAKGRAGPYEARFASRKVGVHAARRNPKPHNPRHKTDNISAHCCSFSWGRARRRSMRELETVAGKRYGEAQPKVPCDYRGCKTKRKPRNTA